MVTQTILCCHCGSTDIIRFGHQNSRQRYRCRTCGKTSRENKGSNAYDEAVAYDLSDQELPTSATMSAAPEPSPALLLVVLSALILGAVGVRRMKDLRASDKKHVGLSRPGSALAPVPPRHTKA